MTDVSPTHIHWRPMAKSDTNNAGCVIAQWVVWRDPGGASRGRAEDWSIRGVKEHALMVTSWCRVDISGILEKRKARACFLISRDVLLPSSSSVSRHSLWQTSRHSYEVHQVVTSKIRTQWDPAVSRCLRFLEDRTSWWTCELYLFIWGEGIIIHNKTNLGSIS